MARESGKVIYNVLLRGSPPRDPHACAHLLALADHLLSTSEGALRDLVASVPAGPAWIRDLEAFIRHCSPAPRAVTLPQSTRICPRIGRTGVAWSRRAAHADVACAFSGTCNSIPATSRSVWTNSTLRTFAH